MASESQQENGWRGRPLWAEIDLDALAHNIRTLKSLARGAELVAVVKANAYGHGAVGIAEAAIAAGADRLAVICVEEGEQLRQAGIAAPILVMGHSPVAQARRIVELRLTPTVNSRELALALAEVAAQQGVVQPIHLKVDSGLNRYGLRPPEVVAMAEWLREIPSLQLEGLFTHFANADEGDKEYTWEQYRTFLEVAERLSWIPLRHVSNTANLLDMPEMSLDLVRPGIGIYGCFPAGRPRPGVDLRPVLSLKSRIVRLNRLAPGESVSYGRTWRAQRPSLVGLVMCGYGDGLPRALSNRGCVLVRGKRAPIVGRVCMDMSLADVTEVPAVAEGDEVVLIGRQSEVTLAVEEIAEMAGSISYEVLCGIAARVPRLYLRQGRLVGVESLVYRPAQEAPLRAG